MKIGYFTSCFPYKNPLTGEIIGPYIGGGVELGSYNLAVNMAKRGHEVFVFTTSIDSKKSIEIYDKIKIYRYPSNFTVGQCPISLSLLYDPLFSEVDLDIVHARMGNLPAPLTAFFYAKKMKKKLVVSYHGDWVGGFGGITRRVGVLLFNKFFCDGLLGAADSVIALSENHVAESLFLKKYSKKLVYIPNGVNFGEFDIPYTKEECRNKVGLPAGSKIILFVGSLISRKAPDILLKSMKEILINHPDAYLIFVGNGPLRNELEDMAVNLQIQDNIKFAGYVSDSTTKALYYKAADLFVLPSLEGEAFPNVLLEASVCGLPLVVSGCECFKAIVQDGCNGLLTKTGDKNDLAEKIILLLNDEKRLSEMGSNAFDLVKNLSWEKIAQDTEQFYITLIR
jgi:glycosyltransferase involved in cell wall biosynthesis